MHRSAEAREAFDALTDIPNAYLNTNAPLHAGQVHTEYGGMQVLNGFRVDVSALSGNLAMLHFQHGTVQHFVLDFPISFSQERYHTALGSFHTIIDCRGYQTAFDQSWQFIPFRQNKGEVLRVKITDPPSAGVYIKDCILVPLQDGTWWAGAHNSWTDHSPFPTTAGKESLENALNKLLSSSYKILDHQAAFRPAIRDRAPVVGRHPHLQRYYLLNGLGTKGYSLAPYHALMLADHILNENPSTRKWMSPDFINYEHQNSNHALARNFCLLSIHHLFLWHRYIPNRPMWLIVSVSIPRDHNVDMEHLFLDIAIDPYQGMVAGVANYVFHPIQQQVDTLFSGWTRHRCQCSKVDGNSARFRVDSAGVTIFFSPSLSWGSTHELNIEYGTSEEGHLFCGLE